MRSLVSIGMLAVMALAPAAQEKSTAPAISLGGAWTRNKDLSDAPAGRGDAGGDRSAGSGGPHRGGGGGGGYGGGGRGGGRGGGYGGGGRGGTGHDDAGRGNAEEMARMQDAMRDIVEPPDHIVITQTDSMVVLTAADGRTTRLSPDGKKIKDDNTKIERKTKWDGGKLVSEINGLGPGKMTQTFAVDPETRQLRVVVVMEGGQSKQPRMLTHVYDADPR